MPTIVTLRSSWVERLLIVLMLLVLVTGLVNRSGIEEFNKGNPIYVDEHDTTQRLICETLRAIAETDPQNRAVRVLPADCSVVLNGQ